MLLIPETHELVLENVEALIPEAQGRFDELSSALNKDDINNNLEGDDIQKPLQNGNLSEKNGLEPPVANNYIGQAIILIATNIATKFNFKTYTWKDEMIGDRCGAGNGVGGVGVSMVKRMRQVVAVKCVVNGLLACCNGQWQRPAREAF